MAFEKGNKFGKGRPRLTQEDKDIRKMCLEHAEEAVSTLLSAMREDRDIGAAREILDRAFGKPVAHTTSDINVTHHDARKRFEDKIARLIERRATEEPAAIVH